MYDLIVCIDYCLLIILVTIRMCQFWVTDRKQFRPDKRSKAYKEWLKYCRNYEKSGHGFIEKCPFCGRK